MWRAALDNWIRMNFIWNGGWVGVRRREETNTINTFHMPLLIYECFCFGFGFVVHRFSSRVHGRMKSPSKSRTWKDVWIKHVMRSVIPCIAIAAARCVIMRQKTVPAIIPMPWPWFSSSMQWNIYEVSTDLAKGIPDSVLFIENCRPRLTTYTDTPSSIAIERNEWIYMEFWRIFS